MPAALPWRDEADDETSGVPARVQTPRPVLRDAFLTSLIAELDAVEVYLPSLYHSLIRHHPAMAPVIAIERKLREGQAHDALNELRLHITARYSLKDLEDQGAGQAHGKRMREMDQTHKAAVDKARDDYRRIRDKLLVLGLKPKNNIFRQLDDSDCRAISESRRIGDSRETRSWLWADLSILSKENVASGVKEFMIKRMLHSSCDTLVLRRTALDSRPHWFQCSASKARWEEEVYLRREEMYRTLAYFKHFSETWIMRAMQARAAGRYGADAYARR